MKIILGGIIDSMVNGPGMRRVYFAQGCSHNCRGCFNQHTHSFTSGQVFDIEYLVHDLEKSSYIHGVTFSGGDPFYQDEAFTEFAKILKKKKYNIWVYTGFKFEEVKKKKLINYIDVLVDGPYIEGLPSAQWRGSNNQKIINLEEMRK